jgi:hypothetical protein
MLHRRMGPVVLALALAASGIGSAAEVTFTGATKGQFNNIGGFGCGTSLQLLTYSCQTFSVTTLGGFAAFGGGSTADALGQFTLAANNSSQSYAGNTFQLEIDFTSPGGIFGGQSKLYTANLIGQVLDIQGGIKIDFDNSPMTFGFNDGVNAGSFTLTVNDVSITAPGDGQTAIVPVTGVITSATQTSVPEPATYLLSGLGLISVILLRRRV